MALFGFGKKKEEKAAPACACNSGCPTSEATEIVNDCCPEAKDGICCIKVLGTGCASCHELYENAKTAVKAMGLSVEVEYITELQKVMLRNVPRSTIQYRRTSSFELLKRYLEERAYDENDW